MLSFKNIALAVSTIAAVIFLYDWITQFIDPVWFVVGLWLIFGLWAAYQVDKQTAQRRKREAERRERVDNNLKRLLTVSDAFLNLKVQELPQGDPQRKTLEKLLAVDDDGPAP